MIKYGHIILFSILILTPFQLFGQEEEEVYEDVVDYNFPATIPDKLNAEIDASFKLPVPIANRAFSKISNGIADLDVCFQLPVFKFFTIGAGFKYQYFQFRDFASANSLYSFSNSGKLFNYAPFGRISYVHFSSPRIFWQFSVKSGYAMKYFNSVSCFDAGKNPHEQFDVFIEPQVGLNIFIDEFLAISLTVSDYMGFNAFTPEVLCLEEFSGLEPTDSNGSYNSIGVGFGFSYFFHKKN